MLLHQTDVTTMKGDMQMNQTSVVTIELIEKQNKVLRVAAYCRVSSNSQDQLHSFASQVQYYTKTINGNSLMELVDIYADEGLTGTKTAKRDDFNRFVSDCKKGKIDRVLTKSISRFARNTADALMYARILRNCGVSILFEKENIDTAYMSSELLLAISGAQAQEESISISKNMRWSAEKRMQNGTFIASMTPYGYELKDGELEIIDEEAEIVKLIFSSFLSGMGKQEIAVMLGKRNVPKRFGYPEWRINTVDYILRNERYIGDARLKKKYKTETLPFKTLVNHGEKPQYYVENMNLPIITRIYTEYLAGKSLNDIAKSLITDGIYTPTGKTQWTSKVVLSILSNEKYKGDALLQKTYIVDCISKKMKKNNGELPMYYVENNHPAIIDRNMFDRVQEEISRRNSKRKVKEKGTKTELGKYSSKYALSELLFCGNCGTPYRRVTWTNRGKKKVVWRCISRLDYGTKYCKESPSLEETALQNAITEAITNKAKSEGADVFRIQSHLKMYQANQDTSSLIAKKNRLAEINKSIEELTNMDNEAAQNGEFDNQFEQLYTEMYNLKDELDEIEKQQAKINKASDTLNEVSRIIEGLKNHPVKYNDQAVRQLINCIKVISESEIEIQFKDGTTIQEVL